MIANQLQGALERDGQGAAVDAVRERRRDPEPARRRWRASRVSEETFTLAPGTRKELTVTLNGVPSSGYLYGALEVVGLPSDLDQRKGVVAGYRLVNSLRYNAATADLRASRPARSRSSARAQARRSR